MRDGQFIIITVASPCERHPPVRREESDMRIGDNVRPWTGRAKSFFGVNDILFCAFIVSADTVPKRQPVFCVSHQGLITRRTALLLFRLEIRRVHSLMQG